MDANEDKDLFDRILERFRSDREQAAYCYIRSMDEPTMSLDDRRKLLAWLRDSPANVSEVLRVSRVECMLAKWKLAQVEGDAANAPQHDATPNALPQPGPIATIASLDKKRPRNLSSKPARLWKVAAAGAGLTLTALLAFVASEPRLDGTINTGAGQRQEIALADGSIAHVGANTELAVDFSDERRKIHLYRGEAVFDVAKDATRPFTVTTPLIDATAIGTRFGLSMDSGVTATVSEGVVRITDHDNPDKGKETILRAGEQLRVSDDDLAERKVVQVDAVRTLEWANGWFEFHDQTIGEAAREFNRRNVVQIEIQHPSIAALAMTGIKRFPVDSPAEFARMIAAQNGLALSVDRSGKVVRLRLSEHRRP